MRILIVMDGFLPIIAVFYPFLICCGSKWMRIRCQPATFSLALDSKVCQDINMICRVRGKVDKGNKIHTSTIHQSSAPLGSASHILRC